MVKIGLTVKITAKGVANMKICLSFFPHFFPLLLMSRPNYLLQNCTENAEIKLLLKLVLSIIFHRIVNHHRPHTTVKNSRNMESFSRAKLPYFEWIFRIWTREQQELPFLQIFITYANQNLAVLCVKRP